MMRPASEIVGLPWLLPARFSAVRFCGGSNGLSRSGRMVTHRSWLPTLPGRLDAKYSVSPSDEMNGSRSTLAVFTSVRLIGGDHGVVSEVRVAYQMSVAPIDGARSLSK